MDAIKSLDAWVGFAGLSDQERRRRSTFAQAIRSYLEAAYDSAEPPAAVLRRLEWPADRDFEQVTSEHPFEVFEQEGPDGPVRVSALRLGNARYPHMKLQVQPWATAEGFLLMVNAHDQVLARATAISDAEAQTMKALLAANQEFQRRIEESWDARGLPTFAGFMRAYLASHRPAGESS